uniref:Phosphoseryl-tRNA kinase n=1 Tax=Podarcis muralis TaxID=64176 RepID=A0A670IBY0_PODMU
MAEELRRAGGHQLGLCLLCGLPAAGKTTTAQALSRVLRERKGWRCVPLAYDDLIPPEQLQVGSRMRPSFNFQPLLYRHELLLYLEHFLQNFIKGCHYSPPPNRTETTWKRFACYLKEQELIYPRTGTEDSASCQYLIDFIPLRPIYFILDDNFYYRSMRYEINHCKGIQYFGVGSSYAPSFFYI